MKKRVQLFPIAIVIAVLLFGVFSCSKNQDRYQDPPWLGGSSIETLQKKGNYTIFLKLMDMSEYTVPITKQLFTLFVPNDEAFNTYFKDRGIQSVESLSKDEARQLFTLHVLPNPRSRFQLIYEYVWSELQGPNGEYAALFFRKPTTSTSIPYQETVRYEDSKIGQTLLMSTGIKLVPLFSKDYFEDFFGNPDGSDYLYMYPGSKWETGHGDMNWANAMVTESEVRTSSGFIYYIDQVVPPQQSLEEYLIAHQDKFGLYYDILQRFANYGTTTTLPDKRISYLKNYDVVSNIAEEQGAFTSTTGEVRMKDMFTAFIPSDAVLQEYLSRTVLKAYPSLDSVPLVTLSYILQTQLSRSLGLISKIEKSYFNSWGDPMVISRSDIKSAHMCSNGVLYEMNKVLEPNVFLCVPGKLFFDAKYSTFLSALRQAELLSILSNPNQDVTLFAPTNDELYAYNIRYDKASNAIQYKGKDAKWNPMTTTELIMFARDHIYEGKLPDDKHPDFPTGDGYVKMISGNFIHYSNNGVQGCENLRLRKYAGITETIVNDKNGILYNISDPIEEKYIMGKFLVYNKDVSKFKDLLVTAKLLDTRALDATTRDTIPNLKFLADINSPIWTAFIPTNDAMDKATAAGDVPDAKADPEGLKNFLMYHFVRHSAAESAIFDDGVAFGTFNSNRIDEVTTDGTVYSTLQITNTLNNLTITDHSGQVVNVDHAKADFLVRKGVVHKISSVLKY